MSRLPKITIKCPSCQGDGIYKRPTSITRDQIPYCFRCNGAGKLTVTHRQAQKMAEDSTRYPLSKLAKVKTPEGYRLVPYGKRNLNWMNEEIEIPF